MASTAAAYRNSDGSTSGKRGNFFSRDTLETLFENCDLRPHHVNMIAAMWRAAGKPHGQEILLFAAVEGYRIEARYRSRRAVQYNLRALEALGVIELAKAANTIRRPATYRLRTDQLGKRQTYADIKNARKSPPSVSHSSPPPAQEPAAPPSTPHTAAPVPVAPSTINEYWVEGKRNSHRSALGSRAQQRVHELRQELVARMVALMRGDGKNRAPMSQENAFTSCCMYFGISADEAAEQLKLVCFKPPAPLQPDFPREPQKQIPPHEGSAWEKILVRWRAA